MKRVFGYGIAVLALTAAPAVPAHQRDDTRAHAGRLDHRNAKRLELHRHWVAERDAVRLAERHRHEREIVRPAGRRS
jgi:Ni/Co efflux regulator RcnB